MSAERAGCKPICPVRPEHETTTTTHVEEAECETVEDELAQRAEGLKRRIEELEEKLVREEGRRPIVSLVPERPTEKEVQ